MESRPERSAAELSDDEWWKLLGRVKGRAIALLPERLRQRVDGLMALPHGEEGPEIFVFLLEDSDLANSELAARIQEVVHEALDGEGVSPQMRAKVRFVWDSKENVAREYGGNYYNRMR